MLFCFCCRCTHASFDAALRCAPPVQARIHEVNSALAESNLPLGAHAEEGQQLSRYPFREDPAESKVFWDVRKGLIPIVGGGREPGARAARPLLPPVHTCPLARLVHPVPILRALVRRVASLCPHGLQRRVHGCESAGPPCKPLHQPRGPSFRAAPATAVQLRASDARRRRQRAPAGRAGTSFLIEDVACPVDKLADMTVDLVAMFEKYKYKDASCFGHALEGNLHLVFSQARPGPPGPPSLLLPKPCTLSDRRIGQWSERVSGTRRHSAAGVQDARRGPALQQHDGRDVLHRGHQARRIPQGARPPAAARTAA